MTKEELFNELEPYTIQFKKDGKFPIVTIATIAIQWINTSNLSTDEAFDVWDNVMAELVTKHNLARKGLH